MTPEDLLQQALSIDPPWRIVEVLDKLGRNQIDVWIGHSGWFFGSGAAAPETHPLAWRYTNVGQARCLAHAPLEAVDDDLPWSGSAEQPLTHALPPPDADVSSACNCILNFLHLKLKGKHSGGVPGPRSASARSATSCSIRRSDARLPERRRVGPR